MAAKTAKPAEPQREEARERDTNDEKRFIVRPNQPVTILCGNEMLFHGTGAVNVTVTTRGD